jgi:hypothetical protein
MHDYQRHFVDFMLEVGVLTFGDFTTKSGRKTPYFVNTGKYRSGVQLAQLGRAYADAIERSFPDGFDCLFGPAYKNVGAVTAYGLFDEAEADQLGGFRGTEPRFSRYRGRFQWVHNQDLYEVGTAFTRLQALPILSYRSVHGAPAELGCANLPR